MSSPPKHDPRLEEILDVLLALARQDFSRRAPVSEQLDTVDAIATGLNLLGEELDGEVASRKELAGAYRSLTEAQTRLLHAGKLAAVGQLASGVVHEINNPATWVMMALGAATRQAAEVRRQLTAAAGDPVATLAALTYLESSLGEASEGMDRIRWVINDLRTFSRSDGDGVELLVVNEVVQAACKMATPSLRDHARIVLDLGDLPAVRANRGKLGQVVTNLLLNASQAINERHSPENEIRVLTRSEGVGVSIIVEDTGPGVPPALRDRIFDPFFTTKPEDMGTGLGLSLVAEIVRHHGGEVRVGESDLGGARFEVLLPIASAQVTTPPLDARVAASAKAR